MKSAKFEPVDPPMATPDAPASVPAGFPLNALSGNPVAQAAMARAFMARAAAGKAGAAAPARRRSGFLHHVMVSVICLVIAAAALGAHEHYRLTGRSTPALVSLLVAGAFALVPVRAILHVVFGVGGSVAHAVHGIGSLAFVGLGLGGVVSGGPILSHSALAPFAIMGAAQAIMHQDHPRNAQQAAALRAFATSLPEVQQIAAPGDLTSPANAQRAVRVLTDLIGKAQTLGETELAADPAFQSAWSRATTRTGLSLGMDVLDQAINRLAANPATASYVPALRKRLAEARGLNR
jgi:hypothetical protein